MSGQNSPDRVLTGSKRGKALLLIIVLVVVLGGALAFKFIHGAGRVTTDDAYIEGRIHRIASRVPGTAVRVLAGDNQPVKKGDLLLEIDTRDFEVKVSEARAALEAEKARLVDAEAGINAASANLEVQEVALNQALLDKQRMEALFKENVIPREKMEKVQTAHTMAVSQVKAAKEQLAKARSMKELQESLIKLREAALSAATLNLSYCSIIAPSDGYVTKKSVEEGNQVQAGQPLMAVVALDDIWVVANYKETELKDVRPGQSVSIKVDTYPGRVFRGKVDSIMAGTGSAFSLFPPENALGNYVKVVQRVPVKIVFDAGADREHVLRVGMSCVPTVLTHE